MANAQRAWQDTPPAQPTPSTAAAGSRRPDRDEGAALDQRAMPLTRRELLPMAAILVLISALAAVTIVYLTAFGRLAAQGAREQQVDRQISFYHGANQGLQADLARLQRQERLEQEAQRLGLVRLGPAATDRVELPAGSLEDLEPVAPAAPRPMVRTSALPR